MQAALTVRRKQKEDLKEALAGHLDALRDMVGLNVALELISTKILLFPAVFAFAVGETKFLTLQILLFTRGKLPYAFPFCALLLESVLAHEFNAAQTTQEKLWTDHYFMIMNL